MPCDASSVYYKAISGGKDKIVTVQGEVISGMAVSGTDADGIGYRPHWVTCPQASNFRKKKQPGGKGPCSGEKIAEEICGQLDIFGLLGEGMQGKKFPV